MDITGDIEANVIKDHLQLDSNEQISSSVSKNLFIGEDSPTTSSLGSGSAGSDDQTIAICEQKTQIDTPSILYYGSPNLTTPNISNLSYPSYTSISEQSMGITFEYLAKNILITKDWSYLESGGIWGFVYGVALVCYLLIILSTTMIIFLTLPLFCTLVCPHSSLDNCTNSWTCRIGCRTI